MNNFIDWLNEVFGAFEVVSLIALAFTLCVSLAMWAFPPLWLLRCTLAFVIGFSLYIGTEEWIKN